MGALVNIRYRATTNSKISHGFKRFKALPPKENEKGVWDALTRHQKQHHLREAHPLNLSVSDSR